MKSLVATEPPFGKINKGSGNAAIQCLVPGEFNQSRHHVLKLYTQLKLKVCAVAWFV